MSDDHTWDSAIEYISKHEPALVLVEGAENVGKTPFSRALARELRGLALSTDSFIRSTGNPDSTYSEMVDRAALMAAVAAATPPVVLEGVCLREVIPEEAITKALRVYIRRVEQGGVWRLADDIEAFDESDFVLCIELEVLRYHKAFAPHEACDVLVTLADSDRPD